MTNHSDPILVIGATGHQGGAVARELLRRGHAVHAMTRDLGSPRAGQLANDGATLVHGDMEDHESLRKAMDGVRGVFSVQTFFGPAGSDIDGEVRRGRAVADVASDTGVGHVVYGSVGGADRDSGVPHFESKWAIEQYLRRIGVPTTVLRPVFFMENLIGVPPELRDGTLVVRRALDPQTRLQMIATADIGAFAADAFERPDDHIGRAIEIAGDELTGAEVAAVFQEVTGVPTRYERQPLAEIRAFSDDLARMFEWFERAGYAADIPALRQRQPQLRTMRQWLRQSGWHPAGAE